MPKAIWNGQVLAEADAHEVVEGVAYFPADSLKSDYFRPSGTTSHCPWKGNASYYDVVVDGETNRDAAWYYPDPKPEAAKIKGMVAFWKGVQVEG